jgi:hypothetical protein
VVPVDLGNPCSLLGAALARCFCKNSTSYVVSFDVSFAHNEPVCLPQDKTFLWMNEYALFKYYCGYGFRHSRRSNPRYSETSHPKIRISSLKLAQLRLKMAGFRYIGYIIAALKSLLSAYFMWIIHLMNGPLNL